MCLEKRFQELRKNSHFNGNKNLNVSFALSGGLNFGQIPFKKLFSFVKSLISKIE
jgi:hypothetical protein